MKIESKVVCTRVQTKSAVILLSLGLAGAVVACGGDDADSCEAPAGTYEVTATFRDATSTDPEFECTVGTTIVKQTSIFPRIGTEVPGCNTTEVWPSGSGCRLVETTTCVDGYRDELSVTIGPDNFSGIRILTEDGCRVESYVSAIRIDK
jgi:hypothetical protein